MQENATITTAEVINKIVDDLIAEKGLDKVQDEQKAELKRVLSEQLIKRINLAILKKMPDDKFEEFDRVAKDKGVDFEKLQDVAESADINMGEILEEVVPKFREKFLGMEIKGKAEA